MAPLDTTIRQPGPPDAPPPEPWSGWLDASQPAPGSTIVETTEDGGVRVRTVEATTPERNEAFDENLAALPELEGALAEIAQDILDGIDSDIASRQAFIDNYTRGLDQLGLVIENQSRTKGQKRKTSTVRDTTLLESVVKAQSQARGELLPAGGPAKVRTVAGVTEQTEQLANEFEADFNLALTKGMPEYVPDLDRGLFGFFYGGNMFRYGHHCPLSGRPKVATITADDLIVSEEATDLQTAMRVTHRAPPMSRNEVMRRMKAGVWRECDLGIPMPDTDAVQQKKQQISGVTPLSLRPKDQPYTFFQTITDLDLSAYGLDEPDAGDLPRPYRITVERYSRQIVRIERWWKDGDPRFARKRRFVHYGMVPGFGFLAYGFLHLQGNQVVTLTAIVRLLVDAMMFGTFPAGVKIKGARTETNEIEPGPGEFPDIGVPAGVDDIRKVIMALPYKDLSPVSIQLYELVQQACARVGAAAMMEVGEGRANVPVGTIMAMLEEKSIVMAAVHKRLHEAMSQELSMIRELFLERPETLAEVLPPSRRTWAAEEFSDFDLVPASDPNVPSQVHRIMLATALATLASMPAFAPKLNIDDILQRILRMLGVGSPEQAIAPPQPAGADPAATAAEATLTAKQMELQAKNADNQRKAASDLVKTQQQERDSQRDLQNDALDRASDEKIAGMREDTERLRLAAEEVRDRRQTHMTDQHHQDDMATRSFGGGAL